MECLKRLFADAFVRIRSNKKQKLEQQQNMFDLLPDDVLHGILQFVGRDQHLFIESIDRRFQHSYSEFQQEEHRTSLHNPADFQNLISTKLTSAASIAESLSRAKLFLRVSMLGDFQNVEHRR